MEKFEIKTEKASDVNKIKVALEKNGYKISDYLLGKIDAICLESIEKNKLENSRENLEILSSNLLKKSLKSIAVDMGSNLSMYENLEDKYVELISEEISRKIDNNKENYLDRKDIMILINDINKDKIISGGKFTDLVDDIMKKYL